MKIHVVAFTGAGVSQYAYKLCDAISKMDGKDVTLICSNHYELDGFEHNFRLKKIFRRSRHYFIDIWEFLFFVYREKPDVLNFQSTIKYPAVEAFMIKFLKRRIQTIIFTAHEPMPQRHRRFFYHNTLYRFFYRQFRKIIVFSNAAEHIMRDTLQYRGAIKQIPIGVYSYFQDKTTFTYEEARQRLHVDEKKKMVLFFGAIRPDKGLGYLIESFGMAAKKYENAILAIAGKPSEPFEKYNFMIEEAKIKGKTILALKYLSSDEVSCYLTAADFVVLPYIESTTSGVMQVAFGFWKPVIATNVGNLPEVIQEGVTGFLVPPRDANKLAEKILVLLKDDQLRNKMRISISKAIKTSSWDNIAAETLKFYLG